MSHQPEADELRVRYVLRARGVGPDATALPPMPVAPPTGFESRPRDWLDDILDTPMPAPATPGQPPDPPAPPEDGARPPRRWSWLTGWIRPWHTLTAGVVAVLPVFGGWSLTTGWAHALHDMRSESVSGAYLTAAAAVGLAFLLDLRRRRWLLRLALITTTVGALGVLDWYDPVTLITGAVR